MWEEHATALGPWMPDASRLPEVSSMDARPAALLPLFPLDQGEQ